jgi:peptidoglycan/LPS O-acetylase OafA/YrhL
MDALRASTMFLLVPVHAAGMLSINGHEGAWATVLYWIVHVFRMPLFFAMSGFFLAMMLGRKGLAGTARNRSARIAVPLALGMITLVPLMMLVAQLTGTASLTPIEHAVPEGSPFTFELSFLWFLWYLLIVDGAAIALYLWAPGLLTRAGLALRRLIMRPLGGILILALVTAIALWPEAQWMATPSAGYIPDPAAMAYYALFFGFGAALHTHWDLVVAAGDNAWRWLACALAAALPAALLFGFHNSPTGSSPVVHGAALLIYAIATWSSLIALVGLANRYLNRSRPALRYLADSSYWIYLSHLPPMILVLALLEPAALGTAPTFLLVTAASIAASLVTYPLFVRYTVIGRLLNGRRIRTRPRRRLFPPRPGLRGAPAGS